MFHAAPLFASALFAAIAVFFSLRCSSLVYANDPLVYVPYEDIGFQMLPDLASEAAWVVPVFASAHALITVVFFAAHVHRITILRRVLLILGASIFLEECQKLSTTWPNPNDQYLGHRGMVYDVCVTQVTLVFVAVTYYIDRYPQLHVAWFLFSLLGIGAVISTRTSYTVDAICAMFPPVLLFMLYHWYCRSEVAIVKRQWVYWFERDVFCVSGRARLVEIAGNQQYDDVSMKAEMQVDGTSHRVAPAPLSALESPREARWPCSLSQRATYLWNDLTLDDDVCVPVAWNLFYLGPTNGQYAMYWSATFAATDGRGPSDATLMAAKTIQGRQEEAAHHEHGSLGLQVHHDTGADKQRAAEYELNVLHRALHEATKDKGVEYVEMLVQRAASIEPTLRWWQSKGVAACCAGAGALVGTINLVSIHIADARRPIGLPLPPDLLHDAFPKLPDHTADIFLYPIILATLVFTMTSRYTWAILSRVGIMYACSMLFRMVTMLVTSIPDPSPTCAARDHPDGTTCGDLVYSGHTVGFLMCALTFRYFTRERRWGAVAWCLTAGGLLSVVMSRLHYTRDVVTSLIVIALVNHSCRVLLFKRVSRIHDCSLAWWLESPYYIAIAEDRARHSDALSARSEVTPDTAPIPVASDTV